MGAREYQEDRATVLPDLAPLGQQGAGVSFFGVFDGHGGAEAAEFAAQAVRTGAPRTSRGSQSYNMCLSCGKNFCSLECCKAWDHEKQCLKSSAWSELVG